MKKVSMRGILMLGMPGLIVGIVISLILSTHFSTRRVFIEHAQNIMQNIVSSTIDKAQSHLEPARDAALLTSALAVNNIVTSIRVDEMEHYFYEQLLINSQFSNIYYGTQDGKFIMVSRADSNRFLTKIISLDQGERDVHFKEMNLDFSVVREYFDPEDNYDPRTRPWYTQAVEAKKLIWTNPYIFYTSQAPGITTASPVYNRSGDILGVVGVDIEISDLSEFIANQQIGKNGKAFILDEKGQVIAYPDRSKITHRTGEEGHLDLVEIGELEDDVSKAAYNSLQNLDYDFKKGREFFFTFTYNGEVCHAMFAPFNVSYWPWLMGIYIPEDDYFSQLKQNRTFTIFITLFLGLFTSLIGFKITGSILSSLKKLQDAAERVGRGQLQTPLDIRMHYTELEETAAVFEIMRGRLEEYSSRMEFLVKNRTEELEKKNRELEEEIQHRNRVEKELIYARNRADESRLAAEAASKAKNTFLANISHEIRTPLSGIIGYAELMHHDNAPEINVQFRETILRESERLIVLINRLLDISKIEAGKFSPEINPFNLNMVVEEAWSDVMKLLEEKGLKDITEVDPDIPDILLGDSHLLTQILTNLLSNSVKFTHKGFIALSISAGEKREDRIDLRFIIKDTGIGIPPDKQEEVFRIFHQGDNSITRRYGGSGLGLSIVKELTELMGGTISVKSSEEQGSIFSLSIPFGLTKSDMTFQRKYNPRIRNSSQFKGLSILLAEDYSVNRDLIRLHLEGTDCTLFAAHNGQEAIEIFRKEEPDIVLMDVQMPVMDGLEATRLIRKEKKGKSVCIIGVTANAFPQDLKQYWKAGMNDCLVKPFRKQDLFDKLKHWEKFSKMHWGTLEKGDHPFSVFESQVLMETVDADSDMAKMILDGFRKESMTVIELFDNPLVDPPLQEIHRQAHSLRSGSLNIGAFRLAEAAFRLEKAVKEEQPQLFEKAISVVIQEYRLWERTASEWETSLNNPAVP